MIDSSASKDGFASIDVQAWMNHISLDSIGIAGFSHNFGTLEGKPAEVADLFDAFAKVPPGKLNQLLLMLAFAFPWLLHLPTKRQQHIMKFNHGMEVIANELLDRTRKELTGELKTQDNSIIGLIGACR